MPQPPLQIEKYLETPLPHLREQYPPGTGGTGKRSDWSEGTLKGVQVIDDFQAQVKQYLTTLSKEPVHPHPNHKYPKFLQDISTVPNPIKSPADLQKCLSTLPLAAVASMLTAMDTDPEDLKAAPSQRVDKAGYESDGEDEPTSPTQTTSSKTKSWYWRFNKSPLGSGEFQLLRQGSNDVKLVVRTINSSAFTAHDWEEYVVTGPYHYDTRSKASWYWSRSWGATNRLGCQYWVLTDWQRWVFGKFNEKRDHGWISPMMKYDAREPSILQSLFYWSKSAMDDSNGFKAVQKDVSGMPELFPANPARRVSVSHRGPRNTADNKVKAADESDIEESDAE